MVVAQQRMKDLANFVAKNKDVYCLLGLGSMSETSRADQYSDMDFFIIVHADKKQQFLDDLSWLAVCPIQYQFKNSKDGYKILYDDGIYAEFAVFTPSEIVNAHFTKGKIYYTSDDFDSNLVEPEHAPKVQAIDLNHHLNEALTNVFVGLKRLHRGEIASATTFIQVHAYHNVIALFDNVFDKFDNYHDPYVLERRIEYRYKSIGKLIMQMRPGYNHNQLAAKTILTFLNDHFSINTLLKTLIEKML